MTAAAPQESAAPLPARRPRPLAFFSWQAVALELRASLRYKDHRKFLQALAALNASALMVLILTSFIIRGAWGQTLWIVPMIGMMFSLSYPAYRLLKFNNFTNRRLNVPIQTMMPGTALGPGLRPKATPNLFDLVTMILAWPGVTMLIVGNDRTEYGAAALLAGGITSLAAWRELGQLLWAALPRGAFGVLNVYAFMTIIGAVIQAFKHKFHLGHIGVVTMLMAGFVLAKPTFDASNCRPPADGVQLHDILLIASLLGLTVLSWWIAANVRREAQRRVSGVEENDDYTTLIPGEHFNVAMFADLIPLPILPLAKSEIRKAAKHQIMTPARSMLIVVPLFALLLWWLSPRPAHEIGGLPVLAIVFAAVWLIGYAKRFAVEREYTNPKITAEGSVANHIAVGVACFSLVVGALWAIVASPQYAQAKIVVLLGLMAFMAVVSVPQWQHRPMLKIVHPRSKPMWVRGGVAARLRRRGRSWWQRWIHEPADATGRVLTDTPRARFAVWWTDTRQHYPVWVIPRLWGAIAAMGAAVAGMRILVQHFAATANPKDDHFAAITVLFLYLTAIYVVVKRLRAEPEHTMTEQVLRMNSAELRVSATIERGAPAWPMILHDGLLSAALYGLLVWYSLTPGLAISPRQGFFWDQGPPRDAASVWIMCAWPLATLLGIGFVIGLWPRLQRFGMAFLGMVALLFIMVTSGTPFVLLAPPALYFAWRALERRLHGALVENLLTPQDDDAPREVRAAAPQGEEYFRGNGENKYAMDESYQTYYDPSTAQVSRERFRRFARVAFFLSAVAFVMMRIPDTASKNISYTALAHVAFWLLLVILYVIGRGTSMSVLRPSVWWALRCGSYRQWPFFWRDLGFRVGFWIIAVGWPFLVRNQEWPADVGFFSGLLVFGLLLQLDRGDSDSVRICFPWRPRR